MKEVLRYDKKCDGGQSSGLCKHYVEIVRQRWPRHSLKPVELCKHYVEIVRKRVCNEC